MQSLKTLVQCLILKVKLFISISFIQLKGVVYLNIYKFMGRRIFCQVFHLRKPAVPLPIRHLRVHLMSLNQCVAGVVYRSWRTTVISRSARVASWIILANIYMTYAWCITPLLLISLSKVPRWMENSTALLGEVITTFEFGP